MTWKKSRNQILSERFMREEQEKFELRMKRIMALADTAMKQAHPGDSTFPVRSSVVVDYDRLLMIWDIAERAKSETCVR